jgi:hypothetical protein
MQFFFQAHPEYGQILATCSFDNTIQVYDKDCKTQFIGSFIN